jgi:molybdate transport system substrate-binding protein
MKTLIVVSLLMMPFAVEAELGRSSAVAQVPSQEATAPTARIRIFSSDAVKEVMEELLPQCERAIGKSIDVEFNRSAVLKLKIEAGDAFDVAIIQAALLDDVITKGNVAGESRSIVGRTGIGIGIRAGAPKADIDTPAALKRVLLNAKSITYAPESVSRMYIDQVYERLGIADEVAPKIIFQQEPGRPLASVAEGKAELVVILISEILAFPGVELLGPLPAELQNYIAYAAGVASNSQNATAARALIRCISEPAVTPVFRSKGLER